MNINDLVRLYLEEIGPSYNFDTNDNDLSDNNDHGSLEVVERKGKYDKRILKKRRKIFDEEESDGNLPEDRNRIKDNI